MRHAPVSSADVDPIYYGAVHIDLSAMDALSGVKEIWWRLNGGDLGSGQRRRPLDR